MLVVYQSLRQKYFACNFVYLLCLHCPELQSGRGLQVYFRIGPRDALTFESLAVSLGATSFNIEKFNMMLDLL